MKKLLSLLSFDLPPFLTANCSFLPDFIQKNLFKICLKNYLFVSISLFGFQWSLHFVDPSIYWWAQVDSNHRPRAYQARALTCWAMSPFSLPMYLFHLFAIFVKLSSFWWRWWDSNPWPPACRAGALPAELHPHLRVFILNSPWKLNNRRFTYLILVKSIWVLREYLHILTFSIERRWSSRTFWYGYLVTT